MEFTFSEEQEQFREMVRRYLADRSPTTTVRETMETGLGFDPALWADINRDLGLAAIAIPEEHGGQGFSWVETCIALEEAGRALLCAPLLSTSLAGLAITLAGDEETKTSWLPRLATGDVRGTIAFTEADGNWDVSQATARLTDGRLTGVKHYVLDGASADLFVINAVSDQGVCLAVVPADEEGVSADAVTSLDPTRRLATVTFDGAKAQRLLQSSAATSSAIFDAALVAIANESVGGASALLEETVEYVKMRHQFGRPIGSFQAVKHRCANMLLEVELAKSVAYYAAEAFAEGDTESATLASAAKASAGDAYLLAARDAIQLHGGIGFTWDNDTHLWFKRAKHNEVIFGDPTFHRERVMQNGGL